MIGAEAEPAIPALARVLADPNERYAKEAATVLFNLGSVAWPTLESSFENGNWGAQSTLMEYLSGRFSGEYPQSDEATKLWYLHFMLKASANRDPAVRSQAVKSLSCARTTHSGECFDSKVIPRVIEMLDDDDSDVRLQALKGVREMWRIERHCVDRLHQLTGDSDSRIQEVAQAALDDLARGNVPY